MEAASAASLSARLRARGFERECERLRPLGEAYVLRRFGGSLGRADAEDAVAEVLFRLHRQVEEGRPPRNLRAAFFTAVRNAAIDQLRSRAAKPTAPLEAAAQAPAAEAIPAERAESREDAVRLQEALTRMRGNYRETILLRFGLGFTVPEIAAHFEISLPAAKKLVLRATRQVRERMESIEGAEFCPQMREAATRSLLEKEASELASESEAEALRAHFAHCGSCRSFALALREHLHDLGSTAVLGLGADRALGAGVGDRLSRWLAGLAHGAQQGTGRLRHLALRAFSPLQGGDGAAGALIGSGQKIAAICGAGAASAAACLLTGAVGPGIGITAGAAHAHHHHRPPPKVRRLSSYTTQPAPAPASAPSRSAGSESTSSPNAGTPASTPAPEAPASSSATAPPSEFGIESGSSGASTSSPPPAPGTSEPSGAESSGGEFGGAGSGSAGAGSRSGGGSVGFHG